MVDCCTFQLAYPTPVRLRFVPGIFRRSELHLLPLYGRIVYTQIQVNGLAEMRVQVSDMGFRRELRVL